MNRQQISDMDKDVLKAMIGGLWAFTGSDLSISFNDERIDPIVIHNHDTGNEVGLKNFDMAFGYLKAIRDIFIKEAE